jgi:hypothetical protein
MKYLCLVCFDGKRADATMSKSDWDQLTRDSIAYDQELVRNGAYITSAALQSIDTATTVRMRNGKVSATDGPFAETKEQVAGFILINAANLDEAIAVASKIPIAKMGSIEVRPIMDLVVA